MRNSTDTGATPKAERRVTGSGSREPPAAVVAAIRDMVVESGSRRLWVGYSGGLDSSVLLYAASSVARETGAEIRALHFDHGLDVNSNGWAATCVAACAGLGVPLERRTASIPRGGNLEERARRARYAWFSERVGDGDLLLLGHHRDDQAETLLYNLLRGAGVVGAAAMPRLRRFGRGLLGRPLLGLARRGLVEFATRHGLTWVDDPSNESVALDRNFMRLRVMPMLRTRFPGADAALARAADNFAQAAEVLAEVAAEDLAAVRVGDIHDWFQDAPVLDVTRLAALGVGRRGNLLRSWLAAAGVSPPTRDRLSYLQQHLLGARRGGTVAWSGLSVRRYRDRLYIAPPAMPADGVGSWPWNGGLLELPSSARRLCRRTACAGLTPRMFDVGKVTVRCGPGSGTERIRVHRGGRRREMRKLYQEHAVAPWLRDRLPRVYVDGVLVAVAGVAVAAEWRAGPGEDGWLPVVEMSGDSGVGRVEDVGALW